MSSSTPPHSAFLSILSPAGAIDMRQTPADVHRNNNITAAGNLSSLTDQDMNSTNLSEKLSAQCLPVEPRSDEFFESINVAEAVIIALCGVICVITNVIFIDAVIYVLRHYRTNKQIKYKTIQILGIYPAVCMASFIAVCIPRADVVAQQVSSVYVSRVMYNFISLTTQYFGGSQKMRARLKDSEIVLRAPPCCCCCFCLPKLSVTRENLRFIKILVLQFAIVQPILACVTVVLWIDEKYVEGQLSLTNAYTYLQFISVPSMLIGIYGFLLWHQLSKDYLRPAFIVPKFIALQLVLILEGVQGGIFSVLAKFGIPECEGILSSRVRGQAYSQMLFIFEMLLVSLLARCFYRRSHDHLADLSCSIEVLHEDVNDVEEKELSRPIENGDIERKVVTKMPQEQQKANPDLLADPTWLNELGTCRESDV